MERTDMLRTSTRFLAAMRPLTRTVRVKAANSFTREALLHLSHQRYMPLVASITLPAPRWSSGMG